MKKLLICLFLSLAATIDCSASNFFKGQSVTAPANFNVATVGLSQISRNTTDAVESNGRLLTAIHNGDLSEVQNLLSQGVDVNCNIHGIWPVEKAFNENMLEIFKLLVVHGADLALVRWRNGSIFANIARGNAPSVRFGAPPMSPVDLKKLKVII